MATKNRPTTVPAGSTVQGTSRRPVPAGGAPDFDPCQVCGEAVDNSGRVCSACLGYLAGQADYLRGVVSYVANLADTADELRTGTAYSAEQSQALAVWVAQQAEALEQLYTHTGRHQVEAR